jgi:hypothetical protein
LLRELVGIMAIANSAPQVETDHGTIYIFEDERLFDAMAAVTKRLLDQYDDQALLSQPQPRLVAKVKRAVQEHLQREAPDRLAAWNPWHFSRALGAYVTRQVRKYHGMAFERMLAEDYGPLQPVDAAELVKRSTVVNGVRVIATDPPTITDVEAGQG